MIKKTLFAMALATVPVLSLAAAGADVSDAYFSKAKPNLTPQERAALAIGQKWQAGGVTEIKPIGGNEGFIKFVFGAQQTGIVCAVLQICDVELQPGEQVNSINVGDKERWIIDPAVTGTGSGEVMHLIIKPLDVGLETSLVVTTNRRTYHLRLRSHRTEYMPRVGFIYSEDGLAKWDAIKNRESKQKQVQTIPETGEQLGGLNFNYDVVGSAKWKPLRVYNDGRKTIIQLPASATQTEAPTLLVLRKEGNFFSDDETVMVNYRVQDDRYIVDSVFDKAILISGVGSNQDRVVITNKNPSPSAVYSENKVAKQESMQEPMPVFRPAQAVAVVPVQAEPVIAVSTAVAQPELTRWEILESDQTLQKTLARWGRVANWDVQFRDVPEMRNPGYVKVNGRDFLGAADWLLGQAKTAALEANFDLSITAYPNQVLVISAKDVQK